jgi:hypothetical protein
MAFPDRFAEELTARKKHGMPEEFGLVRECDARDVAEIGAPLRAHSAEEVSVVEA